MTADAIVVGSGPNGLAAAITLAQAGLKTVLRDAQAVVGGGLRYAQLTLPGYTHDVCSAVHPLALSSPFFRTLPLVDLIGWRCSLVRASEQRAYFYAVGLSFISALAAVRAA